MTTKLSLKILVSLLSLIILYHLSNFIFYTKEKFVSPTNIKKLNNIYNISISSNFDYYIGNTAFYKNKEIIFYKFDKEHIITIIRNGRRFNSGIKNNKIYPIKLNNLISSFDIDKFKCKKITSVYPFVKKGFVIKISSKKKNIRLNFLKDNIYITEIIDGYNTLFKKNIKINRNFKCNFDIYMYNDFILKIKKLSIIKKNIKE